MVPKSVADNAKAVARGGRRRAAVVVAEKAADDDDGGRQKSGMDFGGERVKRQRPNSSSNRNHDLANERTTMSLSHLRTLLPESSSQPLPAKQPSHAT